MKGISDFISTVLIIAITISVGIALFNWIEPLSRSQADKVADDSTNKLKCQSASLRITTGKLNSTSTNVSVLAENTGNVNLAEIKFNIVFTNGTNINTPALPAITLAPSSKQTLTTTAAVANGTGNLSSVRLIATCTGDVTVHDDLDGNTFSTVA